MPCGAAFAIQSAAEDATGVIKLALTQTQEVLLQEEAEAVLEEHQHLAIRTLAKRLDSADAVDFIGRRHDFHQPLPAGFLAIVINRCAKLCDSDHILCSKGTTIWQRNLITVVSLVVKSDLDMRMELAIGQQGSNRVALTARCQAGGHHALCLKQLQLLEAELETVVAQQWPGCSSTVMCLHNCLSDDGESGGVPLLVAERALSEGKNCVDIDGSSILLQNLLGVDKVSCAEPEPEPNLMAPEPEPELELEPEPEPQMESGLQRARIPRWVTDGKLINVYITYMFGCTACHESLLNGLLC